MELTKYYNLLRNKASPLSEMGWCGVSLGEKDCMLDTVCLKGRGGRELSISWGVFPLLRSQTEQPLNCAFTKLQWLCASDWLKFECESFVELSNVHQGSQPDCIHFQRIISALVTLQIP